jgi:hypothetical protein
LIILKATIAFQILFTSYILYYPWSKITAIGTFRILQESIGNNQKNFPWEYGFDVPAIFGGFLPEGTRIVLPGIAC